MDKNKTYELSERGEKDHNIFNKTGGFQNINRQILLSEDSSKKAKPKIKMNIIYEKPEQKIRKHNKSEEKKVLISFNTNNNFSYDSFYKILEKHKINQIKHFSSYNGKKPNNRLIKNFDNKNNNNDNEKIIHNKYILFKQKAMPILENENSEHNEEIDNNKHSLSNIDEDSILISNKKMNYYEPFDLNLAYIKPRKVLKEELTNLFEKHKIKYRSMSNARFMVELKKEEASLGIKFDKLNIIQDDNDNNNNNIRISVIKIKRINGNYQSDIKAFEKIIYKLN